MSGLRDPGKNKAKALKILTQGGEENERKSYIFKSRTV